MFDDLQARSTMNAPPTNSNFGSFIEHDDQHSENMFSHLNKQQDTSDDQEMFEGGGKEEPTRQSTKSAQRQKEIASPLESGKGKKFQFAKMNYFNDDKSQSASDNRSQSPKSELNIAGQSHYYASPFTLMPLSPLSQSSPFNLKNGQKPVSDNQSAFEFGDPGDEMDFDEAEFSERLSEDSNISIQQLLNTEEQRMNYIMLNNSIYCHADLFKLCLACILSDSYHSMSLKILSVLSKKELQKHQLKQKPAEYSKFLPLMTSYTNLRLS
jgi:hypothetical protein